MDSNQASWPSSSRRCERLGALGNAFDSVVCAPTRDRDGLQDLAAFVGKAGGKAAGVAYI
jgi:hypothetical protein